MMLPTRGNVGEQRLARRRTNVFQIIGKCALTERTPGSRLTMLAGVPALNERFAASAFEFDVNPSHADGGANQRTQYPRHLNVLRGEKQREVLYASNRRAPPAAGRRGLCDPRHS